MSEWEIIAEDGDLVVEFEKSGKKREEKKKKGFSFPWSRKPEETGEIEDKLKSDKGISIPASILKSMEIRAQSIFRPKHEDFEVLYALSGDKQGVNTLHPFSSEDVLYGSDSGESNVNVENMIAHIKAETGKVPELLVILHTHPGGEPIPSTQDKLLFSSTARKIKQHSPETEVFYGIHAISGGSVRAKKEYKKVTENTIKWSSITHDHEVAFYTEESKQAEANIL